jgi:hypothetical protein
MSDKGRIVNLSSEDGRLYGLGKGLDDRFRAAKTTQEADTLMNEFKVCLFVYSMFFSLSLVLPDIGVGIGEERESQTTRLAFVRVQCFKNGRHCLDEVWRFFTPSLYLMGFS